MSLAQLSVEAAAGFGRWRSQRTSLPTPQQLRDLKLHTGGGVGVFDERLLRDHLPHRLQRRLDVLEAALFGDIHLADPPPPRKLPQSNLQERHIAQLLSEQLIEELPDCAATRAAAQGTCCFLLAEESKGRLRTIVWSERANAVQKLWLRECQRVGCSDFGLEPEDFLLALPSGSDVVASVASEEAVALADLQAAFWQRSLPPRARPAYTFTTGGRFYAPTRMTMGATLSCYVMQLYTLGVALGGARPEADVVGAGALLRVRPSERQIAVYIDNIRVSGERGFVVGHRARIISFAERCRVTLQPADDYLSPPPPTAPRYDFLGVEVARRSVRARARRRREMVRTTLDIVRDSTSLGAAATLTGQLTWAAQIVRLPLREHLPAILWLRRCANAAGKAPERRVLASLRQRLEVARLTLAVVQPRSTLERDDARDADAPAVVFSDASHVGWGAVLLAPEGGSLSFGGRWSAREPLPHINVLEGTAAVLAVEELLRAEKVRGWPVRRRVLLWTDSMVLLGALRRGSSRSPELTAAVVALHALLRDRSWRVEHVPSERNPADAPSRCLG